MSSKDIRSFFIRKDGGSSSTKSNDSLSKSGKKRTLRVIESDDEEDDENLIFEKSKPKKSKEAKSNSKTSPPIKKEKEKEKKEKEKEKPKETPVSVSSFFGTSPVQQKHHNVKKTDKPQDKSETKSAPPKDKTEKNKKKKKEKPNSQPNETIGIDDDCFDEELGKINIDELEMVNEKEKQTTPVKKTQVQKHKTVDSPKKDMKKTPIKESRPETVIRTPGSAGSKSGKSSLLDSDHKRRNAESYQRYLNRSGPKHPGSKEIPKGTPTCLNGLTFVISGVLDSMEREEAVELIQRCGGRTTSSVSKKTSFIVVGEEAGQAKLEKANKLGTKKLTEDELLELIRSKSKVDDENGSSLDNFIEGTPTKDESKYFKNENKLKRTLEGEKSPDVKGAKVRKVVEVEAPKFHENKKTTEVPKSSSGVEPKTESKQSLPSDAPMNAESTTDSLGHSLWVDKYKPQTTKKIIGQAGDKSNVKKLIKWLETWAENNLKSNSKKPRPAPWQSHDGSAFKAALLSGPPGVGKTTTAHLVCKELGFDIVEFNASDTRSKRLLQEEVTELLRTKSIRSLLQGSENIRVKHVLVMDEVDGMAGNEDRGGIQELIQIIKQTKVPIICMCNDRSHPKIRSLVNYCYDLRFSKPRVEQIKGAMMSVCFKEQIKISSEALEEIIINANQDIRQVLHNLSLWSVQNKMIGPEEAKKESAKAKKPLVLGPWDVARRVFSASDHSTMTFKDKEELFFQDYNLGPLFVQDCYVRVKPYKAKNDKIETLNLLSKAADALMYGDIVERAVRSENAWGLLPVQAIFSSVLPGHYMEGHVQGQIQFPVWFGKNSKTKRYDRILQELQTHMRLSITGSKEAVNLDYLKILRNFITKPLLENGTNGIPETLQLMSDYNLTKDDVDNIMELSLWPGEKDVYASIDSKVKAALTRAYNKEGKAVPFAVNASVKKSKITEDEYDVNGELLEDNVEDEVADDLESDAMIKKGKPKVKEEKKETKEKNKKEKEKEKTTKDVKKERKKK